MDKKLLNGPIAKSLLIFSLPLILGNLLQQLYNIVDTLIVGKVLGPQSLVAVGSSYTLMVLLTSIILGLCMGSGVIFARCYGAHQIEQLKANIFNAFLFICGISLLLLVISYILLDSFVYWLQIPLLSVNLTKEYLHIIFIGILFTTIYNFIATILRSVGNSRAPLYFLAISTVLNIVLDLYFMISLNMGVRGAALATVISQAISAILITVYYFIFFQELRIEKVYWKYSSHLIKTIISQSSLTAIQQSIMNFGILMIQGLVNSFGGDVSAAFAIVVKIDAFAYMPAQDFGNAFAIFVAQNHGSKQIKRIEEGIKQATMISLIFCLISSCIVFIFAKDLIMFFIDAKYTSIISIGITYLHIEGSFYEGIGLLFLLYALYRGLSVPGFSIILTIISLGTRVLLAYLLANISILGIWWSIPIGWFLADLFGFIYYFKNKDGLLISD